MAVSALDWLRPRGGNDWSGFDPIGWEVRAWILHAMYETDELPTSLTHDDVEKTARAADPPAPLFVGKLDLNELFADSVNTGIPFGPTRHPGQGWRRLLWHDLATRTGEALRVSDDDPVLDPLRRGSWPVNMRPPAAGALDHEQYLALLDVLQGFSGDASCYAFVARLAGDDVDEELVLSGTLAELASLYDDDGVPSNLWPSDRSWFVSSDWDETTTRVSGSNELISALERSETLEVVRCGPLAT